MNNNGFTYIAKGFWLIAMIMMGYHIGETIFFSLPPIDVYIHWFAAFFMVLHLIPLLPWVHLCLWDIFVGSYATSLAYSPEKAKKIEDRFARYLTVYLLPFWDWGFGLFTKTIGVVIKLVYNIAFDFENKVLNNPMVDPYTLRLRNCIRISRGQKPLTPVRQPLATTRTSYTDSSTSTVMTAADLARACMKPKDVCEHTELQLQIAKRETTSLIKQWDAEIEEYEEQAERRERLIVSSPAAHKYIAAIHDERRKRKDAEQRLAESEKQITLYRPESQTIKSLQAQIAKRDDTIKGLEDSLEEADAARRRAYQQAEAEKNMLRAQAKQRENKFGRCMDKQAEDISLLTKKLVEYRRQLEDAKTSNKSIKQQMQLFHSQLTEAKRVQDLEKNNQELKAQIQRVQHAYDTLKDQPAGANRIESLENTNRDLKVENERLQIAYDALKDQSTKANRVKSLEKANQYLKVENERLQSAYDDIQKKASVEKPVKSPQSEESEDQMKQRLQEMYDTACQARDEEYEKKRQALIEEFESACEKKFQFFQEEYNKERRLLQDWHDGEIRRETQRLQSEFERQEQRLRVKSEAASSQGQNEAIEQMRQSLQEQYDAQRESLESREKEIEAHEQQMEYQKKYTRELLDESLRAQEKETLDDIEKKKQSIQQESQCFEELKKSLELQQNGINQQQQALAAERQNIEQQAQGLEELKKSLELQQSNSNQQQHALHLERQNIEQQTQGLEELKKSLELQQNNNNQQHHALTLERQNIDQQVQALEEKKQELGQLQHNLEQERQNLPKVDGLQVQQNIKLEKQKLKMEKQEIKTEKESIEQQKNFLKDEKEALQQVRDALEDEKEAFDLVKKSMGDEKKGYAQWNQKLEQEKRIVAQQLQECAQQKRGLEEEKQNVEQVKIQLEQDYQREVKNFQQKQRLLQQGGDHKMDTQSDSDCQKRVKELEADVDNYERLLHDEKRKDQRMYQEGMRLEAENKKLRDEYQRLEAENAQLRSKVPTAVTPRSEPVRRNGVVMPLINMTAANSAGPMDTIALPGRIPSPKSPILSSPSLSSLFGDSPTAAPEVAMGDSTESNTKDEDGDTEINDDDDPLTQALNEEFDKMELEIKATTTRRNSTFSTSFLDTKNLPNPFAQGASATDSAQSTSTGDQNNPLTASEEVISKRKIAPLKTVRFRVGNTQPTALNQPPAPQASGSTDTATGKPKLKSAMKHTVYITVPATEVDGTMRPRTARKAPVTASNSATPATTSNTTTTPVAEQTRPKTARKEPATEKRRPRVAQKQPRSAASLAKYKEQEAAAAEASSSDDKGKAPETPVKAPMDPESR
ncbi:uncharacterized protein CTRU02_204793 [Colletotrichum truncatum]|uniref:Uncharacterized protein n=1 Tax=Colletotrichum truncatum TaxID=5467 RepID=A0ACC3ZDE0_COLTU|nr:uncharacterized protein CTRU02_03027 [Colletotrichum truncatum]KAF6797985.1 hypothetical protein CTRU02_03027 [Colletotrichum truncatum]